MKISVITPSYNQGKFIRRTLDSVLLNQDYTNIEHLVMDGLSTDETIDILKEYKNRFKDKLIFISEKDKGQSNAINKGFKKASGEIIGWINSDDYYEDKIFSFVVNYFKDNPDVDMLYGICDVVDEHGKFVSTIEEGYNFKKRKIDYREFKYDNLMNVYSGLIPQPAVFFRTSVFDKVGYLDESFNFVMDYEYWLRIGRKCKIKRVEKHLANFRTHQEAKTTFPNRFKYFGESLRARRKNGGGFSFRFYSYIGFLATKTVGRIVLTRLGILKDRPLE